MSISHWSSVREYRQQEHSFVKSSISEQQSTHGIIQSRVQNCPVQETTHNSRGCHTPRSFRYSINYKLCKNTVVRLICNISNVHEEQHAEKNWKTKVLPYKCTRLLTAIKTACLLRTFTLSHQSQDLLFSLYKVERPLMSSFSILTVTWQNMGWNGRTVQVCAPKVRDCRH